MHSSTDSLTTATQSGLAEVLQLAYGPDAERQVNRYGTALSLFQQTYGKGDAYLFRAPGRVNLIGEHTDYNHGYVMPVALERDILLVARPRRDRIVHLRNSEPEFPSATFTISQNIPRSQGSQWSDYVRGAAQMIARLAPGDVSGMDCLVSGELPYGVPRGSGLSSSSALTVAAAVAFAHFAGLQVDRQAFAAVCSDAEWYVGTRGGIMDQFISLLSERDHALFLDCRPGQAGQHSMRHVPLPEGFAIMIADSGIHHHNTRGLYNLRVASCRVGVALLQSQVPDATHLRDLEAIPWQELEPMLPEELTVAEAYARQLLADDIPGLSSDDVLLIRSCCRHVWHENHRVLMALSAFDTGDVAAAGRLISEAHASARDDYDISFPEMETLVRSGAKVEGVAGGRITGAGWGGCAMFLVARESVPELLNRIRDDFDASHGRIPTVFPCQYGSAAGYIDKRDVG